MKAEQNRLIVALDVATAAEALRLVDMLRDIVGMFKVGLRLFTAAGPDLVRDIVHSGERVFLDLKFHDIPNTVAAAGVEATRLGVSMFNVHAAGGHEMMRRTADAVAECANRDGINRPTIIAVTALTSADDATLAEVGIADPAKDLVCRLSLLAQAAGLDGVVASPLEVDIVRSAVKQPNFVVVTPGVRPAGGAVGDQKRVTTPREAILAGADYLVVGRPILEAKDPSSAALAILEEMEIASAKTVS